MSIRWFSLLTCGKVFHKIEEHILRRQGSKLWGSSFHTVCGECGRFQNYGTYSQVSKLIPRTDPIDHWPKSDNWISNAIHLSLIILVIKLVNTDTKQLVWHCSKAPQNSITKHTSKLSFIFSSMSGVILVQITRNSNDSEIRSKHWAHHMMHGCEAPTVIVSPVGRTMP